MVSISRDELTELRKNEIQELKNELIQTKETLEKEVNESELQLEKLKLRFDVYEKVKNDYYFDDAKAYEDNFFNPAKLEYDEFLVKVKELREKHTLKIAQIQAIVDCIENKIQKQ